PRRLDRSLQDMAHLVGVLDHLAVVTALGKEVLGVGLLEVAAANLRAGNVSGDGDDGDAVSVAIVESIDEVHVAGAAAARAGGQLSGEVCVGPGGEGGDLLVPDVDPADLVVPPDVVGDAVQRVSRHSVHP